ncbi:gas vesicle protein [Streptomyces sp. R21]|uniref:Gas vesicle protein n=1 Tax=Streptomyces sp. R21 TaxID=3238627 RepID=A0AB39PJC7_9ACTN
MTAEGLPHAEVALVDLLDRLLAGGVVIAGDLSLSIADVELVRISLRALLTSVEAATEGILT